MLNTTLQLKILERLNKLSSSDFDSIECWKIVEAFNKAQLLWCRRQLHGENQVKEGDEQSTTRVDDLQNLLNDSPLTTIVGTIAETAPIPANYLKWKKVSSQAKSECCPERNMIIYQVEEANIDLILKDKNKQPSFDWGETISTLKDNKIVIYTNGEFTLVSPVLTYYRQPINIQILDCVDPYSLVASTTNVICEFKDDIVELMIDEAASILAGDIENTNQKLISKTSTEQSN